MSKAIKNKLEFEYKLTGLGWASCRYVINNQTSLVTASYLSDALGAFAKAVQHISDGQENSKCSFDEEPGEYRWIFQRQVNNRVQITVLAFNELWGDKPDSEGKVLVDELCDLHDLDIATKNMLERVLLENGIEGYKEKWCEHEFPMANYLWFCNKLRTQSIDVVENLKAKND